jgi:hypothetical protein
MGAHDQQLNIKGCSPGWIFSLRYPVYNTVVLAGCGKSRSAYRFWVAQLWVAAALGAAALGGAALGGAALQRCDNRLL